MGKNMNGVEARTLAPEGTTAMRELGSSDARETAPYPLPAIAAASSMLALCMVVASGGCSLLVESEGKQCETTDDCQILFGAAPYTCERNYCVRSACASDQQCVEAGFANGVCTQQKTCVVGCGSNSECGGAQRCDVSTHQCVDRQCSVKSDCSSASPTVMCNDGVCEDSAWSCINQADDRPAPTQETATLKLPVTIAVSNMAPTELELKACPLPTAEDPDCATPLEGAVAKYEPNSGLITVSGLAQGALFRLMIDAPNITPTLVPTDFFTQMPVRDTMDEPGIRMVPESYWAQLSRNTVPDRAKGSIFATFFDCQGTKAAGVSITIGEDSRLGDTKISYFEANSLVGQTLMETTTAGLANVVNLPTTAPVKLTASANKVVMPSYEIRLSSNRMANVHFFPRDYAK